VGKGTSIFSQANPGDQFDLLGPLGKGFEFSDIKEAILIGGGIGVAPLVYLAEEMQKEEIKLIFIQGFQTVDEVCCLAEIKPLVDELIITTDDGSYGFHGLVTDQLKMLLNNRIELSKAKIFICGPNPMMAAVEKLCDQFRLDTQFSLEAHMACGFGVCVGCAIPTKDHEKYYLVCEDGPVFSKGEVDIDS
jgi:dihydroorotate dehydrogenase electron transfer subunit